MKLILLVALLSALPSFAADPEAEQGLTVMGWSKAGHVALRQYSEIYSRERACRLEAVIVDLVTDKIVWQSVRGWVDGDDEEALPDCPGAKGAWAQQRAEIEAALKKFKISGPESRGVKRFPAAESLTIELEPAEKGYDIKAKSPTLGSKVLGSASSFTSEEEPSVVGWVAGPDKNRIAVLVQSPCYPGIPCWIPQVVGCHLRTGFKK